MYQVNVYGAMSEGSKALSTNFKVREFSCKDMSEVVLIHPELVQILQKIRTHFKAPVTITSGYRTPTYNKKIDGAKNSQHMYGLAADIKVTGVSPKKVAAYAETLMPNKGGIGIYEKKGFTHIDVRSKKARWNG